MKQVEVTIIGQSYILACPDDGEAALLDAVSMVDREMSAIRDAGKVRARERMAVLAALNLAYRLSEQRAQSAALQGASGGSGTMQPAAGGASAEAEDGLNGQAHGEGAIGSQAELQALIARLDAVLAEDGRLL